MMRAHFNRGRPITLVLKLGPGLGGNRTQADAILAGSSALPKPGHSRRLVSQVIVVCLSPMDFELLRATAA
jgi:hypothetical protein